GGVAVYEVGDDRHCLGHLHDDPGLRRRRTHAGRGRASARVPSVGPRLRTMVPVSTFASSLNVNLLLVDESRQALVGFLGWESDVVAGQSFFWSESPDPDP